MEMKLIKRKLNRRGTDIYQRYFFNSIEVLNYIVQQIDNNLPIDESKCEVIFDTIETSKEQIYELIRYYPNLLKEKIIINDEVVKDIYNEFGETLDIMRNNAGSNVRGRLTKGANYRAKAYELDININSEDIKLVSNCPYLGVELKYNHIGSANKYSPSLDKIDPTKGYVKGNIQVISLLANQMKSSANKTELLTFANSIIKLYG